MPEVASNVISSIESYQQHLTTLSLAVIAGAFALLFQIIIHNTKEPTSISLRYPWLILAGIGILFASIAFGELTKSVLVSSIPTLHHLNWSDESAVAIINRAGLGLIMKFAALQVITFLVGILMMIFVLIINWRLVR